MILESCQAISKASSFVCGDNLRDNADATVMFKVGIVSYEPVARFWVCYTAACYYYTVLCSRLQCLCIPTAFFTQISDLYLFFSFETLKSENWIFKILLHCFNFTKVDLQKNLPANFFSHKSTLVYIYFHPTTSLFATYYLLRWAITYKVFSKLKFLQKL